MHPLLPVVILVLAVLSILLCFFFGSFSAKVLLELAEGSSVATATRLCVEAGLTPHLTGSEALTMLAPLDDAFKGNTLSVNSGQVLNINIFIKVEFIAELYWSAIDCTGVPNKVATECTTNLSETVTCCIYLCVFFFNRQCDDDA